MVNGRYFGDSMNHQILVRNGSSTTHLLANKMSAPMKQHLTFCRLNRLRQLKCLSTTNINVSCKLSTTNEDVDERQSNSNEEPSDYLLPRDTHEQMYRPVVVKVDEVAVKKKYNYKKTERFRVKEVFGSIEKFNFGFSPVSNKKSSKIQYERGRQSFGDDQRTNKERVKSVQYLKSNHDENHDEKHDHRETYLQREAKGLALDISRIKMFVGQFDEESGKDYQAAKTVIRSNTYFTEYTKEIHKFEGDKSQIRRMPPTKESVSGEENYQSVKNLLDKHSSQPYNKVSRAEKTGREFDTNSIEEQYFGRLNKDDESANKKGNSSFIESQYFGETTASVDTHNIDLDHQVQNWKAKDVQLGDAKQLSEEFSNETGSMENLAGTHDQQNYIERQYFGDSMTGSINLNNVKADTDSECKRPSTETESLHMGYIEKQYFDDDQSGYSEQKSKVDQEVHKGDNLSRYFKKESNSAIYTPKYDPVLDFDRENDFGTLRMNQEGKLHEKSIERERVQGTSAKSTKKHVGMAGIGREELLRAEKILKTEKRKQMESNLYIDHLSLDRESRFHRPSNMEKSSAAQAAEEIRAEMSASDTEIYIHGKPKRLRKVDSMGSYIMSDQVPDFSKATSLQIADILAKRVIYDQDDILAIDKPYGLRSQGGGDTEVHNIADLLERLATRIDRRTDKLHIIHRLDKETTGVMLFAKSQTMADKLRAAFKERQVIKKYWMITKGVPNPLSGIIDIPIGEGQVGNRIRMVLLPDRNEDIASVMKQPRKHRREAITRYSVLQAFNSYALVECILVTGLKHQIRAHMFYGLNCPIIGDNKYAHIDRMAPLVLPTEVLNRLKIRQSKARHLPMHLHARSLIIPNFLDGRNLFVESPFPQHWIENCKRLKIKLPSPRKYYSYCK